MALRTFLARQGFQSLTVMRPAQLCSRLRAVGSTILDGPHSTSGNPCGTGSAPRDQRSVRRVAPHALHSATRGKARRPARLGQLEDGDPMFKLGHLIKHALGRSGAFLDQRRVLLHHLVELVDGGVDLLNSAVLFAR